jgi:membrane-associated protein
VDGDEGLDARPELPDGDDLPTGLGDLATGLGDLATGLGALVDDLPELAGGIAGLAPAEALGVPVAALPIATLGWVARLLILFGRYAYLLAFAGALVENTLLLGFLLPGGTVVALAGAGARAAGLPLPVLIVLAAAGMTGGACVDYLVGRAGLARLLVHPRLQAHPRVARAGRAVAARLEGAAPLLRRHGWWLMLVAHAFGHGRSSLAVAAGAARLPLGRFLAIELPAALLWATLFAGGGYLLADRWQTVELAVRQVGALSLLLVPVGGLVWWWHRRRARATAARADKTARVGP